MVRFGELFLKSEPVRRQFMKVLIGNIRNALSSHQLEYTLGENRSRILIRTPDPALVVPVVCRIFGVVDASPALLTGPGPEALIQAAVMLGREHLQPGMRFAIRARRDQVPGFTSQELGAMAGSAVIDAVPGVRVDLTSPEYEIFLEARRDGGIAYDIRIPGPGGLPYGTQGSLLALLSAGIDSPVAAWLMMKRGVKVRFVYVDTGTYAGSDCFSSVLRNLAALSTWTPGIRLDLSIIRARPFFDLLITGTEPRYRCVLCKRGMLRMAQEVARHGRADGLVTGDNLGQVATQTLQNLITISPATPLPVIRPLIGFDKEEIIALAKKIGSFSAGPADTSCSLVPPRPATSAQEEGIVSLEEQIRAREMAETVSADREVISALNGEILTRSPGPDSGP